MANSLKKNEKKKSRTTNKKTRNIYVICISVALVILIAVTIWAFVGNTPGKSQFKVSSTDKDDTIVSDVLTDATTPSELHGKGEYTTQEKTEAPGENDYTAHWD